MVLYAVARQSFRRHLTYRAAAAAGLLTNFFFGILRVAVITAFYDGRAEAAGITLPAAITFTALSQAVIGPLAAFGWYDVMRSVHSGEIAGDLLRPMGYLTYWLAHDFGRALTQFLLRGVPMLVGYVVLFPWIAPAGTHFVWPQGGAMWAATGLCAVLAWLVSFGWRFVSNLSAFWSPDARGIIRFVLSLSWFASGFLFPLRYFPDWLQRLCALTPFAYTVNAITEVYLGLHSGGDVVRLLAIQAAWAAALLAAGALVLRAGVRRLVILGG